MTWLARSSQTAGVPPQTYLEHVFHVLVRSRCYLRRVLEYAWRNGDAPTVRRILALAAEYHDLGKLDDANQRALGDTAKAAHLPLPHADAGVAHLIGAQEELAAFFVYAHHAGLPNFTRINVEGLRNPHIQNDVDSRLPLYLSRHGETIRPCVSNKLAGFSPSIIPPLQAADVRLLFSCLTHADHGDAARASGGEPIRFRPPKLRAAERLEKLKEYTASLSSDGTERNRLRAEFFASCAASAANDASPITYCDAPVGTGKTTAVTARLLSTAAQHGLRRVFVILPFTNIITQSVKVYRKALVLPGEKPEDVVAEIHHRADFNDIASRKLTALWDAPIVVTTAVAFFETLASATPSTLRRMQNLPGSAVFLDEAHAMLPVKLLPLAWQWIRYAADKWSCHWILASGSLCRFWTLEEFAGGKPDSGNTLLLQNVVHARLQTELNGFEVSRVTHKYCPDSMNLEQLASWLFGLEGPVIAVLNTVHTAAAAARAAEEVFGAGNVLHLSTALTPVDRETTLELVRARLRYKGHTKWCLIATSCVEAGVDLSFRTGVRECASLLSVLQLAGRVNRNSEFEDADVWTITLDGNDANISNNPAYSVSSRVLADFFKEGLEISPALCTQALTREVRETAFISKELEEKESAFAFATVEQNFHVIDDNSVLAIVDKALLEKINKFGTVSWRDVQNGSIRVRKGILERLSIPEAPRYPGVYLWTAEYSPFLGYMEGVLKLADIDKDGFAII
jgi:CRISPR-associated endonuclease/helicase Cas3